MRIVFILSLQHLLSNFSRDFLWATQNHIGHNSSSCKFEIQELPKASAFLMITSKNSIIVDQHLVERLLCAGTFVFLPDFFWL